jgi:hypothetical protein
MHTSFFQEPVVKHLLAHQSSERVTVGGFIFLSSSLMVLGLNQ